MERDLRLLGSLLGASAYAVAILSYRREIFGSFFKFTENVKRNVILKELERVEEARGYKLIPKGFLSQLGSDDLRFYNCLRSASQVEIDEWFAEWKSFLRAEKEQRDKEGYLYVSRVDKKLSSDGVFYFDGYSRKWYHQDRDGFLQWTE
ncbi:hypothetical protein NA56DRAFT_644863 [Hyaloscypha hepaticicola]|uniref:Uncharacterized protein n=1 Tax=Hyaloscypha hepaticicola TaxID=2082293 RepID=A0A2J6Q8W2_9HELO|nr:hypothetical protein NA56DRAFT_644863 [Hyaloscypha hepaticicola]